MAFDNRMEAALRNRFADGKLLRCCGCRLGRRWPQPTAEELEVVYASLPAHRWKPGRFAGTAQHLTLDRLRASGRANLRVLDIGAFDGSFLAALPDTFEKSAIEPSAAVERLRERKIDVLKPFLHGPTPEEEGAFDAVTLFDVFEHLIDPVAGVQDALRYLKPGGRLFISTGNMDHWSWQRLRGEHWYLDPVQHVVFGSQQHFDWLAGRLGVAKKVILKVSHERGSRWQQLYQTGVTYYFQRRRNRGRHDQVVRVLHRLPAFRRLAHKPYAPYTQQLRDHLLVEYTRAGLV